MRTVLSDLLKDNWRKRGLLYFEKTFTLRLICDKANSQFEIPSQDEAMVDVHGCVYTAHFYPLAIM